VISVIAAFSGFREGHMFLPFIVLFDHGSGIDLTNESKAGAITCMGDKGTGFKLPANQAQASITHF
jgi:hypothetical protein